MMKKNFILLIFLFFIGFTFHISAQQKILVKGIVKDSGTGDPLIGVSVAELDNTNRVIGGTVTDHNGEFGLRVSNVNNKLSFQYIGYKTVAENINGRAAINVTLESEAKQIEEVTITAKATYSTGNMNIDQRDMAMAVSRIDAKELEDIAAASIDEAMQGRLSGVDIVANTGDPGAGMSIRIRGTTSIGANADPLIVVDDIPYETKVDEDFNFATADEEKYSQLINIPTEEIKDITVLKDAASASQYGTRAANGVIVINTKRGFRGKPTVSFTSKNTIAQQPNSIPLLSGDQYAMLIREAYINPKGKMGSFPEFRYDPSSPDFYLYSQNTDWLSAVTQTGRSTENNLSVSGGGEKANYRFSVGSFLQDGTTIGTSLNRLTTSIKLDYLVSDKIKFSTDFSYTHSSQDRNAENVRDMALKKMPNMSIYERDPETGEATGVYFNPLQNSQGKGGEYFNPVAMAKLAKENEITERIVPTFRLKYYVAKSLQLSFDVNFDIESSKTHKFVPQGALGLTWTDEAVNQSQDVDDDRYSIYTAANVYWTPNLGPNHSLQMGFKATTNETQRSSYSAVVPNQASTYLTDPSIPANLQGSKVSLESGNSQNRSAGQLASLNYSLLDRYIIYASLRRDGSSKFGGNYRFGYFPSIAGRWRVSGEPFMKGFTFIDDFSLRADYGSTGNSPTASFAFSNNYESYKWQYAGLSGVYPSNMELTNLRWEVTTSYNLGANLSLWKGRFTADFDVYKKRTNDLLAKDLVISSSSGYDKVSQQNVGIMDNDGWELGMNAQVLKSKNWSIELAFNIARNKNVIQEIADNYPQEKGKTGLKGEYLQRIQEGNPLGSFYGYKYKGVYVDRAAAVARDVDGNPIIGVDGNPKYMTFNYPSDGYYFTGGDAIYEDINHDGNINFLDIVYLGDANPMFIGGFGPRIVFKKNLSLSLFFNYRYGNDIINKARYNTENMRGFNNQSTAVLQRWRNPGDVTDIPRALYNYGFNDLGSSRFVEDGSFLRLKTVTLSYSLPKNFVQKLRFQSCRAYITASNLWTLTNYTGQDPEVSYSGGSNPFKVGVDNSMTPRSKDVTLGLSFSF